MIGDGVVHRHHRRDLLPHEQESEPVERIDPFGRAMTEATVHHRQLRSRHSEILRENLSVEPQVASILRVEHDFNAIVGVGASVAHVVNNVPPAFRKSCIDAIGCHRLDEFAHLNPPRGAFAGEGINFMFGVQSAAFRHDDQHAQRVGVTRRKIRRFRAGGGFVHDTIVLCAGERTHAPVVESFPGQGMQSFRQFEPYDKVRVSRLLRAQTGNGLLDRARSQAEPHLFADEVDVVEAADIGFNVCQFLSHLRSGTCVEQKSRLDCFASFRRKEDSVFPIGLSHLESKRKIVHS